MEGKLVLVVVVRAREADSSSRTFVDLCSHREMRRLHLLLLLPLLSTRWLLLNGTGDDLNDDDDDDEADDDVDEDEGDS
jgi:hypothetical protein